MPLLAACFSNSARVVPCRAAAVFWATSFGWADTRKGKQFSAQPKDVAEKTAAARHHEGGAASKADLYRRAREQDVPGRSKMTKAQLEAALDHG